MKDGRSSMDGSLKVMVKQSGSVTKIQRLLNNLCRPCKEAKKKIDIRGFDNVNILLTLGFDNIKKIYGKILNIRPKIYNSCQKNDKFYKIEIIKEESQYSWFQRLKRNSQQADSNTWFSRHYSACLG